MNKYKQLFLNCLNNSLLIWLLCFAVSLKAQQSGGDFLKVSGKNIVNQSGNFITKAVNLGNLYVKEGYMFNNMSFDDHTFTSKIVDVVGIDSATAFFDKFQTNLVTKADIDSLAKWGFNSIRLPFHYNMLTPLGQPTIFYEKGFLKIDQILEWCKANNMYLILDLHAAPGGQSTDGNCDYIAGQSSLWQDVPGSTFTSVQNRKQTVELWKKIASRYVNEPYIGGYDLINETHWTLSGNRLLDTLMKDITSAIRTVDTNHIVFIEGNDWSNNYTGLTPKWDKNMVYSFHKYWNDVTDASLSFILSVRDGQNVPIWLGEFGENSNHWIGETTALMNKHNIGWAIWPYKKMESIVGISSFKEPYNWSLLKDYLEGGTKPSAAEGQAILNSMLENIKLENCKTNPGYLYSLFTLNNATKPFADLTIPGIVPAASYNEGKNGYAYNDLKYQDRKYGTGGTGTTENWNNGYYYRNDGVDLYFSPNENGPIVNSFSTNDWMLYTVNVTKTGTFETFARVSANAGIISIIVDNVTQISKAAVTATTGADVWNSISLGNLNLTQSSHELKVLCEKSGFILSNLEFVEVTLGLKEEFESNDVTRFYFENNQTYIQVNSHYTIPMQVTIANLYGEGLYRSEENFTNQPFKLNDSLKPGLYLVQINYQNKTHKMKVLKQ